MRFLAPPSKLPGAPHSERCRDPLVSFFSAITSRHLLPGVANFLFLARASRLNFCIFGGIFPFAPWVTFSRQRQFTFQSFMMFPYVLLVAFVIGSPAAILGSSPPLFIAHFFFSFPDTPVFPCFIMAEYYHCQHKGRSVWDTHPSCVTCHIREKKLNAPMTTLAPTVFHGMKEIGLLKTSVWKK